MTFDKNKEVITPLTRELSDTNTKDIKDFLH
jgi:hypothetical protein